MLTAGAIICLIMFTVTLADFAQVTTWRKAVPMLITLALFAVFLGARVDVNHPPEEAAGALVFVRGDAAAKALSAWYEEQGLLVRM